ncbi:RNA polymerase sigma factor [Marinicauda pacifica]|uniref:RNA polymerase sigma factor n=1 Tax=Marinicauda pacifica TaxID=1133559 RepID=UPI0035C7BA47
MAQLGARPHRAAGEGVIAPRLTLIAGGKSSPPVDRDAFPGGDLAYARALSQGDPAAARLFMRRNVPVILGLARRLLGSEAEAEDAAQDVYIKVWRGAGRWQPGTARFDSWVGRIAINACYDRLRRRREVSGEVPERADTAPLADRKISASQTAQAVREAVQALPERQRLALELCHFQEHSNIDAAAMMEVSVDALESLLARARRGLKQALADEQSNLLSGLTGGAHEGES